MQHIDPNTTIGAVTLTVTDLERSLAYYQHHIGLAVQAREADRATLGAGDTPLLVLLDRARSGALSHATGLYHFALRVPSRFELARTLQHLIETKTRIGGASDHRVSEALYLSDPDGHGIEIYRDRPRDAWYDANGNFSMTTERLDVEGVLAELQTGADVWRGLHAETVMGHIHLRVADVARARQFYTEVLGFTHMIDYPSASFVSAGGYHHHIGMNTWESAGAPPPPAEAAQLVSYEIHLPDASALNDVVARVRTAEVPIAEDGAGWLLHDPAQNAIVLRVT